MTEEKACTRCKRIVEGNVCIACRGREFTTDFQGYLLVVEPEKSEVAKRLGITMPGRYCLSLRSSR